MKANTAEGCVQTVGNPGHLEPDTLNECDPMKAVRLVIGQHRNVSAVEVLSLVHEPEPRRIIAVVMRHGPATARELDGLCRNSTPHVEAYPHEYVFSSITEPAQHAELIMRLRRGECVSDLSIHERG